MSKKILGCYILDSGMTWGEHVSKIVGKISQAIGYTENQTFAFIQNIEEFVFCYDFTLHRLLQYILGKFRSCAKIHLDKIKKRQNKYARMILNEGLYTPQRSLLLRLDCQSVEQRIKYKYCVLVFKIQNNLTPT